MENEENQNQGQENEEQEEENTEELVTVFSTDSQGIAAVVKSILEEAGIEYNVKGEGIQSMYGVGVLGPGGFSPLTEPLEFQVIEEDAEKAIELLIDVEKSEPIDDPNLTSGDNNENPDNVSPGKMESDEKDDSK